MPPSVYHPGLLPSKVFELEENGFCNISRGSDTKEASLIATKATFHLAGIWKPGGVYIPLLPRG